MSPELVNTLGLVCNIAGVGLAFIYGYPQPSHEEGVGLGLEDANRIHQYLHCGLCCQEFLAGAPGTSGQSPATYARLSVGVTKPGLQVWCERHDCNVLHIWFEGQRHPAHLHREIDETKAAEVQVAAPAKEGRSMPWDD